MLSSMTPDEVREWALRNPSKARQAVRKLRMTRAAVARGDVNAFIEYVMRDERRLQFEDSRGEMTDEEKARDVFDFVKDKGRFVRQQSHHRRMQELMTAHDHLLIWAFLEAGKTHQVIGRVLFELGHNPDLRIAIFSNSLGLSKRITSTIADYIEHSVRLREVFPHLRKGSGPWNTQTLTVARSAATPIKDPSVQCLPVNTGAAQGARIDLAILDVHLQGETIWPVVHGRGVSVRREG